MLDRFFDNLSQPCPEPKGTRIELVSMSDDLAPIPIGSRGTVIGGNGSQLFVEWDSGRSLIVLIGVDQYRTLEEE